MYHVSLHVLVHSFIQQVNLGLTDEAPDKIITVYRDEADVFEDGSMDSFRSAPVTIGHPKDENGAPIKVTAVEL